MPQRHAPATGRNRTYILEVLQRVLPKTGTALETASGSGEHAVYFAPELAPLNWLPSDISAENLASINAWREEFPSGNLLPPISLDVSKSVWSVETNPPQQAITAIVNINMIHISPWNCCEGLLAGAERILEPGGMLFLYGPFMRGGAHSAASNEAFDAHLKVQNPAWGLRNLESVVALAESHGLECIEVVDMPANNLSVIFEAG